MLLCCLRPHLAGLVRREEFLISPEVLLSRKHVPGIYQLDQLDQTGNVAAIGSFLKIRATSA